MGITAVLALLMTILAYVAQSPRVLMRLGLIGQRLDLRVKLFTGYALASLILLLGFFLAGVPLTTAPQSPKPRQSAKRPLSNQPQPSARAAQWVLCRQRPNPRLCRCARGRASRRRRRPKRPPAARLADHQAARMRSPRQKKSPPPPRRNRLDLPPPQQIPVNWQRPFPPPTPTDDSTATPSPSPTATATPPPTATPTPTITPTPIEGITGTISTNGSTLWVRHSRRPAAGDCAA